MVEEAVREPAGPLVVQQLADPELEVRRARLQVGLDPLADRRADQAHQHEDEDDPDRYVEHL
jgi:hypothetical protein